MTTSKIVVGGRAGVIRDVMEKLRANGHDVAFHQDATAFLERRESLADVDVVIASPGFVCSRDLIGLASNVRGFVSPITGYDNIDVDAASERGIIVANSQVPENTESMAEATVLMILAALYDMRGTENALRQNLPRPPVMKARMLRGKTVGLIGFGAIARAVAARLDGWNVTIQAHTRRIPNSAPEHIRFIGLDDLLASSDIVCVLTSLNPESRGLLTATRLRLLKHNAVLVNTARGAIIDEAALIEVARERPDLLLALDTFTVEPLPADSPLRDVPNAILTPHMLGHTQESSDALPVAAVENTERLLAGQLPLYLCNPAVAERWQSRWRNYSAASA